MAQTAELSTTIMFWQHRTVLWQEVVTKPAATSPLHPNRQPLKGPWVPCACTGGLEGASWKMEEYRPFSCRYVMPRLARPAKYGRIQNGESKRIQSKQPGAQPNHELQSEDYTRCDKPVLYLYRAPNGDGVKAQGPPPRVQGFQFMTNVPPFSSHCA